MTLSPEEFMRRFLLHVLPAGFHRIRHYGLLANGGRRENLTHVRQILAANSRLDRDSPVKDTTALGSPGPIFVCPCCGAAMIVVEALLRGVSIRAPPRPRGVLRRRRHFQIHLSCRLSELPSREQTPCAYRRKRPATRLFQSEDGRHSLLAAQHPEPTKPIPDTRTLTSALRDEFAPVKSP